MFTDIFIRRPVFASALNLLLLVGGIASFVSLSVRQFPLIETNVVTVTTTYPGASADLMAGFVSTPLENAIGGVDGIDYMTSSNTQNTSQIAVNLKLGYPIETGVTDTMNEVSSVRWMLPKQIQDPVITKQDPNAQPTVYIAFNSKTLSSEAVTDFLLRVVQPQLQTLSGVSQAAILGEREYAMRLNLNTDLMTSFNITAQDVMAALRSNNLQGATGTVTGQLQQFVVLANTDLSTEGQFENLVIRQKDDYIIRFKDIGTAKLAAQNYNSSAIINGVQTTVIGIIPTSDANPLFVSEEVQKILPKIQEQLPGDVTAEVVYDSSLFIEESIAEVYKTMFEAGACVLLVIFLFLGSFRAIIIPLITIPLSLMGVCAFMIAMNYTIDTISLLAWVLAIGLVVDDAIVVLENIHRHMEEGLAPIPAAIIGAREIGFAVIAMTITLATVYAPIGFIGGLTGILFSEFAFTLAASVVLSGFVALTLSPMMCSRLLTYDPNNQGFAHKIDSIFAYLIVRYKTVIGKVLNHKKYVIIVMGLLYVSFFYLFSTLQSELAPTEDQGVILVYVSGPSASNIKYTEKYTNEMMPILNKIPEMQSYGIFNGYSGINTAIAFVNLVPWSDRHRSAMEIFNALAGPFWAIPGLKIFPVLPAPLPNAGSFLPLQFVLKTTVPGKQGILQLNTAVTELMNAANKSPIFKGLDSDMKIDMPMSFVKIDRDKAGDLGVTIQDISTTLNIMLGTPEDVQFAIEGRGYYVIPEFNTNFDYKANPKDMNTFYVRSKSLQLVPLSTLVTLEEQIQPLSLNHFQQLPSTTLSGNFAPGYTLGDALDFLVKYTKEHFPYLQYDYAGQARQYVQSQGAMNAVLAFALVVIFLVLAAQFESYRDPIIILGVVPLTLAGALITLKLTKGTLNIYSEIGLTTLVGLIAKHGILIVEFANQLQEKGMNKVEAVIESTCMRLRPILMTTFAMVLGALPLALATGAGANARHMIGWTIVGGMSIGTLFSLFVVPTLYSLIAKVIVKDEELERQIQEAIVISDKMKGE